MDKIRVILGNLGELFPHMEIDAFLGVWIVSNWLHGLLWLDL